MSEGHSRQAAPESSGQENPAYSSSEGASSKSGSEKRKPEPRRGSASRLAGPEAGACELAAPRGSLLLRAASRAAARAANWKQLRRFWVSALPPQALGSGPPEQFRLIPPLSGSCSLEILRRLPRIGRAAAQEQREPGRAVAVYTPAARPSSVQMFQEPVRLSLQDHTFQPWHLFLTRRKDHPGPFF